MNLYFDTTLCGNYKSHSQKIRIMSESWIAKNMYCPCCGNPHIQKLENNAPVADLQCNNCAEIFELKTKKGQFGKKITDGAYLTMMNRITSTTNPALFAMTYNSAYCVTDLILIPKFFFVPQIIEKRKPLAPTAKRAGWIGCNIMYSQIPTQGKIDIIKNSHIFPTNKVLGEYYKIKELQTNNIESRGWLLDILYCINNIDSIEFTLQDVYNYAEILQSKHPANNNVKAKIRQQLQLLRDKGFIIFLGQGHYKKI